MHEDKIDR